MAVCIRSACIGEPSHFIVRGSSHASRRGLQLGRQPLEQALPSACGSAGHGALGFLRAQYETFSHPLAPACRARARTHLCRLGRVCTSRIFGFGAGSRCCDCASFPPVGPRASYQLRPPQCGPSAYNSCAGLQARGLRVRRAVPALPGLGAKHRVMTVCHKRLRRERGAYQDRFLTAELRVNS